MGFNTGMSEDDVEEIRREYEFEIGGLEKEIATLRAENERLREALEDADQTLMLLGDMGCRDRIKEALK